MQVKSSVNQTDDLPFLEWHRGNIMFELIKQFAEQLILSQRLQPEPEEDWGGGDICSPQAPTGDDYPFD
jgi:hypothetical protein